jgi:dTDP-4-amino-4,6-dideoxygalactose transaminase
MALQSTSFAVPLAFNPLPVEALTAVLNRFQHEPHHTLIQSFESALQTVTGSPHVVAVSSGTAALHLALKVAGVGAGDVVMAPAFTYVATLNPIRYLGATPWLVDSERNTWNLDSELLKQAIEQCRNESGVLPKAIMVTHTYGVPAQLNEILNVARTYNIPVIEDAAESMGAFYHGQMTGTIADIGVVSFNNNKVLTTYGGGALLTARPEWAEKARFLSAQAREKELYYVHREVGFNYLMNPLAAAAGQATLPGWREAVKARRDIFLLYCHALEGQVSFAAEQEGSEASRWLSAFLFKNTTIRNTLFSTLREMGIETRMVWNPMHQQPVYQQFKSVTSGVSEELFSRGLCLPSGPHFGELSAQEVVGKISVALKTAG